MKLTARNVAALKLPAGKRDHFEWCDGLPGFGFRLRLAAGGKINRTWTVQYRHGGGTRRLLLGSAAVLGADQARLMAKKALGRVANGDDPQADKQDRRDKDRHTLKATVSDYLEAMRPDVRPRTLIEKTRYLTDKRYFGPLHSLALDQITRKDVASRLTRITTESRSSIVAALARAQLSALFTWALTQGLTEVNPVVGTLAPKAGKPRERVLDDSELARIWRACPDDDYGRCIKLLILTGCRRQEIGSLCWSEVNVEQATWTLPPERSKNRRAHTLPMLPAMFAVIEGVPRIASRDQLFGQRGDGFTAWSRGKAALDARSGVEKTWTTHDLRRTVATKLADIGVLPHIIEQILNHQSGHKRGPAGVYNLSSYEREVRSALAMWHDHLHALTVGGKRKVIPMPQNAS